MASEGEPLRSCVFCATPATTNYGESCKVPEVVCKNGDGENVVIKQENLDSDAVPGNADNSGFPLEDSLIQDHLKAVFIVRKLLDLPEEKCVEYLQRSHGDSNPGTWFTLCWQCLPRVEEAYQLFKRIVAMNRKLDGIKCELKSLICGEQERSSRGNDFHFVNRDIRNFVAAKATESVEEIDTPRLRSKRSRVPKQKPSVSKRLSKPKKKNVKKIYKRYRPPGKLVYKCESCDVTFDSHKLLLEHTDESKKCVNQSRCPLCGLFFYSPELSHHLQRHLHDLNRRDYGSQLEKEGLPFYCDNCHLFFKGIRGLRYHRNKFHPDVGTLDCSVCNAEGFDSKQLLELHMRERHEHRKSKRSAMPPKTTTPCPHCPKTFRTPWSRDYHIAATHKDKLLCCQECGFKALHYRYLVAHLETKHNRGRQRCDRCPLRFPSVECLNFHKAKSHQQSANSSESSEKGHESMPNEEEMDCEPLKTERVVDQTPDPPVEIENEPTGSPLSENLNSPEAEMEDDYQDHDDDSDWEPPAPESKAADNTPVAKGKTKRVTKNRNQNRYRPPGIFTHKCETCNAKFESKLLLFEHYEKSEKCLTKRSKCPLCGVFYYAKDLTLHLKRHLHELNRRDRGPQAKKEGLPFYCDNCHLIFKGLDGLRFHRNKFHPNVGTLNCSLCTAVGFDTKQLLELHMRDRHEVEYRVAHRADLSATPTPCPHCHRTFATTWSRDYHIAAMHKDELLSCLECGYKALNYGYLVCHLTTNHQRGKHRCDRCPLRFPLVERLNFHKAKSHQQKVDSSDGKNEAKQNSKRVLKGEGETLETCEDAEDDQTLDSAVGTEDEPTGIVSPLSENLNFPDAEMEDDHHDDDSDWEPPVSQTDTVSLPENERRKHTKRNTQCSETDESKIKSTEETNTETNKNNLRLTLRNRKKQSINPVTTTIDSPDPIESESDEDNDNANVDEDWKPPFKDDNVTESTEQLHENPNHKRKRTVKPGSSGRKGREKKNIEDGSVTEPTEQLHENHKPKRKRTVKPGSSGRRGRKKKNIQVTGGDSRNTKAGMMIPYYCDGCFMIFTSKKTLLFHIRKNHHLLPCHTCSQCNESGFETKQLLEIHCESQHPSVETPIESHVSDEDKCCKHCQETFSSKLNKDYHVALMHTDKLLTCQKCGYKADKYCNYVNHQEIKHETKKYMCELCSLRFNSQSYLNTHKRTTHYAELGITPENVCNICNANLQNSTMLRQHMNYTHFGMKEHFCEYCGKAFARSCDLKKHILLHTAPREKQYKQGPFFCSVCQAKFNVRQGLFYHMKREHSDKFSFKCPCGKSYVTQNRLTAHQSKCKSSSNSSKVQDSTAENVNETL